MIPFIKYADERGTDDFGSGDFGASRDGGSRRHNGIDYEVPAGAIVCSPVHGVVTKLGYVYASDLRWRYVEITDVKQLRHRLFYVSPTVAIGEQVRENSAIGAAQNIAGKYTTEERHMKNHVHYEVKTQAGDHLNPAEV